MALATGQITIIDLNDSVSLQGYISSSQPKTQLLDTAGTTYTPHWPSSNVVLNAELYVLGTATDLIAGNDSKLKAVRWYYRLQGDASYTPITVSGSGWTLGQATNAYAGSQLTISANKMDATHTGLNVKCEVDYQHSSALPILTYKIDIDFSLSKQGATGADAYTVVLDNEALTITADNDGTVNPTSQVGVSGTAKTVITAYKGSTAQTPSATSGANKFVLSLGTITGCTAQIDADNKTVRILTATSDNGSVIINVAVDNGSTIQKILSFSKAKQSGRSGVLQMFQWASSAPTTWPTGSSTYTWSTGAFTAPATPNSWVITPGAGSAGQTLYSIRQFFTDSGSATTTSVTWSANSCFVVGGFGTSGTNGTRTAVLTMYKWSAAAPTTYPGGTASTYTWSTGQFTDPGTLNGWSRTIPAAVAGQTLYGISQTYSDTSTSTTSSVTWSSTSPFPLGQSVLAKYVELNGEQVYRYAASATVPTNTSITLTATAFNTANTTATWQYQVPGGSFQTLNAEASKVTMTAGANPTVAITHDATVWGAYTSLTIMCTIDGASDVITLAKVKDGAKPITSYCWAPAGSTFKNVLNGQNPTLTLTFEIYDGSTQSTGTSYKWAYQDATVTTTGSTGYDAAFGLGWYCLNAIGASSANKWSGADTKTVTIYNALVNSMSVFKCIGVYSSVSYSDTIVVIDQMDPIQVSMSSSNGDVFKNMIGSTDIQAKLYQNGLEIDTDGSAYVYVWSKRDINGALVSNALFTPKNVGASLPITLTQGTAGTSATISASNASFVTGKYYVFGSETVARKVTVSGTSVTFDIATGTALGTAISIKPISDNMKTITVTAADVTDKATFVCDIN